MRKPGNCFFLEISLFSCFLHFYRMLYGKIFVSKQKKKKRMKSFLALIFHYRTRNVRNIAEMFLLSVHIDENNKGRQKIKAFFW